ncbi:TPA: hypothetical protein ACF99E_005178, partial [Salmonella enterica subsp. enterica serovar Newport]
MDILTFHRDFSARTCVAVSQQLSGLVHHPAVATVQHNFTAMTGQATRFHCAGVIHHRVQQHVLTARRQVHP